MFFFLSKLLELVFQPAAFLFCVGFVGMACGFTRFARIGRKVAVGAAVAFAVISLSPLGTLMLRPLEDRFPSPHVDAISPAGIIVLGGSLDPNISAARGQLTISDAASRLTTGVALARRFPAARLIFTGGSSDIRQKGIDEARDVHRLWLSLGVPEERMLFEQASRNTYENATMTRALVAPKPGDVWLLVTSASHMPRSVGIFRKNGWSIVPYPVDYRTYGDWRDAAPSTNGVDSLRNFNLALHEWIGLIAYRLTDKTIALFPAP